MKKLSSWLFSILLFACAGTAFADNHTSNNKAIAKGWAENSYNDRDTFATYMKNHMADDGTWQPPRYVGLGFSMDPTNDEQQVVAMVVPETPASEVLKVGDVFVSVGGVPATPENADRLNFRGKPGMPVKAVIMRDGKEMAIEVTRGTIDRAADKATALNNLMLGDPEDWAVDKGEVLEVVGDGNVVFLVDEITDTEDETGISWKTKRVTRFEFNDKHQVVNAWTMNESRYILEQLGYTISR